jgi:hypothetical protein
MCEQMHSWCIAQTAASIHRVWRVMYVILRITHKSPILHAPMPCPSSIEALLCCCAGIVIAAGTVSDQRLVTSTAFQTDSRTLTRYVKALHTATATAPGPGLLEQHRLTADPSRYSKQQQTSCDLQHSTVKAADPRVPTPIPQQHISTTACSTPTRSWPAKALWASSG